MRRKSKRRKRTSLPRTMRRRTRRTMLSASSTWKVPMTRTRATWRTLMAGLWARAKTTTKKRMTTTTTTTMRRKAKASQSWALMARRTARASASLLAASAAPRVVRSARAALVLALRALKLSMNRRRSTSTRSPCTSRIGGPLAGPLAASWPWRLEACGAGHVAVAMLYSFWTMVRPAPSCFTLSFCFYFCKHSSMSLIWPSFRVKTVT
mmetsp:Transcript_7053/g.17918  ORF Transcript_7053/g.17918 Transcript_7053/m.17918 type:complete len:209 (-) Transcript_7053:707-1333(-)